MKALFIGGTGTISTAITKHLAQMPGWEVYLINRGSRNEILPNNIKTIVADVNDEAAVNEKIKGMEFDTVCDFIGFVPEQLERDFRLFNGKTRQFMYISSASAYQKPLANHIITESTPLDNRYWEYSRNKIACEQLLAKYYRENGFPITIVRPSHTYDERNLPLGVDGPKGCYQVLKRMMDGKPVIIHGDGTTLWTVTHNSDFAKAFVGLMGNAHAIGETFQITSDEMLTWNQIYQTVAQILNVPFKPYYVSSRFLADVSDYGYEGSLIGDKANTVIFDNSKIKRAVPEFTATTRFDQGARICIEYIMSHKDAQREDPEFNAWCDRVIEALENAKKAISK